MMECWAGGGREYSQYNLIIKLEIKQLKPTWDEKLNFILYLYLLILSEF